VENKDNLEENLDMASYIMMHRIYDILTLIATKLNPEDTAKMVGYHEQGYLLGPLPSYLSDEESLEK
jgi:hypothetical protein